MKLALDKNVLNQMFDHAEKDYPNECCGFFFGQDGEVRKVTQIQIVINAKKGDQSNRFQINPKDYQKAEKYALDNDMDLLGVYHSHPDHPAIPSEHDRNVALPYFSYIIISVQKGVASEVRSWQLNDEGQFEEESINTEEFSDKQIIN